MRLSFSKGLPVAHILPLLRKTNLVIKALVILGYLLSVTVKPTSQTVMTPADLLALGGMIGALGWAFLARKDGIWRCAVILFFICEAVAFRLQIATLGTHGAIWSLLIAIMFNYGVATLIPRLLDYLLIITLFWVLLCHGQVQWFIESSQMPLFHILVLWCFWSGAFINYSFMRILSDTLVLKERYRIQAETDALTGIASRRALLAELQSACDHPGDRGGYFVMLDIDDFKHINDEFGHDQGDEVLKSMANSFGTCCVRGRYGRLGGEEFGIVFNDSTEQEVVEAVKGLFQQTRLADKPFSFSAGLARLCPTLTPSGILQQADRQLYQAKRAGKGRLFADDALLYEA
ncbi:hypothetical protein NS274_14340 [Pseudomonas oryzihabitans]|uniref:GGDEF domain-containing protein n=1 Tax=Pseudomonas rhizoryzae TaxID=2571129 RepID=UPI0007364503|nr:GGDEF domain-containing protein [Pseudomonas rhizoryzae]APQ13717.1 hypothetical protein BJP27_20290 [Pseudomonas psychrotolerans]KTS76749.1 hypothetical protein NS274_14340 [Pseudomonas psychrotolerans]KTT14203.1 hypothetical protein NS2R_00725 [Pseudomonas psychrotolerans]KTT25015.1 hypothetical protein SB14R_08170 [Pseudomonas psychrotolerans]KTT36094.1 hypothetical protein SB9_07200 [Pseudomonas psychrotolerans]